MKSSNLKYVYSLMKITVYTLSLAVISYCSSQKSALVVKSNFDCISTFLETYEDWKTIRLHIDTPEMHKYLHIL